jgi:hypothetical protein
MARQFGAEHDAERAARQAREGAVAQAGRERRDVGFDRRIDAAHHRAAHLVAARDQHLRGDERRGTDDLAVALRRRRGGAPVGQRAAAGVVQLDVRDDAQHAIAHFLLKAVHHRQHDDQRRDAERDAEHRDAGDERDEAVAPARPPGAHVAPADLQFVRPVHRARRAEGPVMRRRC